MHPIPYKVTLQLNGLSVEMEIDTGAALSIISEATQKPVFPKAHLSKSSVALQTYSSEPFTVLGQMKVSVSYNGYDGNHSLLVVKDKSSNLIGRDWLNVIRIDWASIKALAVGKLVSVDRLVKKYPNVFSPGVGTMKNIRAQLSLREGSKPRFCRARKVPYALKQSVGKELDRLESQGCCVMSTILNGQRPLYQYQKKW